MSWTGRGVWGVDAKVLGYVKRGTQDRTKGGEKEGPP